MNDEESQLRAELEAMTTRALMAEAQIEVYQQLLLQDYIRKNGSVPQMPTCEVCGEQSYCMGRWCYEHCNEENRPGWELLIP